MVLAIVKFSAYLFMMLKGFCLVCIKFYIIHVEASFLGTMGLTFSIWNRKRVNLLSIITSIRCHRCLLSSFKWGYFHILCYCKVFLPYNIQCMCPFYYVIIYTQPPILSQFYLRTYNIQLTIHSMFSKCVKTNEKCKWVKFRVFIQHT